MGDIHKPAVEGDFSYGLITGFKKKFCPFEPPLGQPFAGGCMIILFKFPFEGGQAPASQISEIRYFKIIHIVCFHNLIYGCFDFVIDVFEIGKHLPVGGISHDVEHQFLKSGFKDAFRHFCILLKIWEETSIS